MYVLKPMYVPTAVSQGGDHGVRSSKSVMAQSKNVPGNVQSVPVNVRRLIVLEKGKTVANQTVKDLSVRMTVKTVLGSQLGSDLDVEWDGEDVVLIEDVAIGGIGNQKERVYWNWRRRKKSGNMV